MKWLILKFLSWFYQRRWFNQYQLVVNTTEEQVLTCELFAKCLEAFNPYLVKGVPRERYIETQVVTSTATIVDLKKWLLGYVDTLRSFNQYQTNVVIDSKYERPENSYISGYGVELSDPLAVNLDEYMRVGSDTYTHITLLEILDLITLASAELGKIEDDIEYQYFTRRAALVINDAWAVLSIFIKVNKLYES